MKKLGILVPLLAAAFAVLFAVAPSASALPKAAAAAMYVRAENPTPEQLGTQIAAISNPDNPDSDRWANLYGANGPNRPVLDVYFRYIKTLRTGDVKYQLGQIQRSGNNITMRIKSSAKGYGTFDENHYWVREDGRWKYDVIRWCKTSPSCPAKNLLR